MKLYKLFDGSFSKDVSIGDSQKAYEEAQEDIRNEYEDFLVQLGNDNWNIVQDNGKGLEITCIDEYITNNPYNIISWGYLIIAYREDTNSGT